MTSAGFLKDFDCSELHTAILAALGSGWIIREGFYSTDQVVYRCKNPGDLVTSVDELSEKIIISHLQSNGVKTSQIISEETLPRDCVFHLPEAVVPISLPVSQETRKGDLWIIDPLDSTIGYVHGIATPSILIAFSKDDVIHSSVIYFPISDELFFAIRDRGSWYLDNASTSLLSRAPRKLSLNFPPRDLQESWVALNKHAIKENESSEMSRLEVALRTRPIAGLVTSEVPNSGIACRVAIGKIGAVIHDNSAESKKQRCWDMAAPKLIIEEAGGFFCNFRGEPTNIWKFEPIIIAQSKLLMEQILDKLKS